jgi:hypothetical protein
MELIVNGCWKKGFSFGNEEKLGFFNLEDLEVII